MTVSDPPYYFRRASSRRTVSARSSEPRENGDAEGIEADDQGDADHRCPAGVLAATESLSAERG